MIRNILVLALILALGAPALADQPVWAVPADSVTVLNIGVANGLTFATIRDASMRGHNTYCVTIGAHIGTLTVTRIDASGVGLSNGRLLALTQPQSTNEALDLVAKSR